MTPSIKQQLAAAKSGSNLERALITQIIQYGLPEPEREVALIAGRRWRWDFVWASKRLAVEVQGGVWTQGAHGRGAGINRDMDKLNAAQLAGWRVLQFSTNHIESGDAILMIQRAILAN